MKMHSKLTFLGSLAILSTSPLALANKAARCGTVAVGIEDPAVCEIAPDVIVAIDPVESTDGSDVVIKDDGAVDGEVTEGEVVEGEVTEGEVTVTEGEVTEGEVVDATGGEAGGEVTDPVTVEECIEDGVPVPLDWIKRGGGLENPDVIFYNMVGGGPTVAFKGETSPVARQIGPDGRVTGIEGKESSAASSVNREKKGPVALVKKGRVFLR